MGLGKRLQHMDVPVLCVFVCVCVCVCVSEVCALCDLRCLVSVSIPVILPCVFSQRVDGLAATAAPYCDSADPEITSGDCPGLHIPTICRHFHIYVCVCNVRVCVCVCVCVCMYIQIHIHPRPRLYTLATE